MTRRPVSLPRPLVLRRAPDRPAASRVTIGHWYGVGIMLLVLALAVCGIVIGGAIRDGAGARNALLNHVDPAILESQRLASAIGAQDSALRASRPADLRRARAEEAASTERITVLLRGAPHSEQARVALGSVSAATESWRQGPSDQRFAAVRAALVAERARLADLQSSSSTTLRAETGRLYTALVVALIVLVVGAGALMVVIRRTILRPVGSLIGRVRAVSRGDFAHPLEVTGPAEIAELSAHVDAMRNHIIEEWREADEARALLNHQAGELRRSNAELEQFAYVASHDLQEPLRKVASFCQMLERRYSDVLDERGRQYIGFAVDGARRMQALINDLLDFSRVGSGDREMTTVDCGKALESALDNLGLARSESQAGITWDPLPEVKGDGGLLTQLFQNLIGNAIKFRGQAPPRVHIGVRRDGDDWRFHCSDNGIGIDGSQADRIFLIFQRLHPEDRYSGTGIGLALCKKIVEYHGGRIWLDTERQEPGTTIRWTLPADS